MQQKELDILIIEDVPQDAEAIEEQLRNETLPFVSRRVETRQEMLAELDKAVPDVVLSDFTLPDFDAMQALRLLQERRYDIPFILVTGNRSEEVAVECIKEGADDYILKASLRRLPSSILNVLKKKAAEREKARAEEALRELPRLIIKAQETERRRVARELHDSVNQILSSVKFRIQAVEERLVDQDEITRQDAHKAKTLLDRAIQEVRRISRNLRPSELDDLGLVPALRSLCDDFTDRTRVLIRLSLPKTLPPLSKDLELNLYRIVQESLNNVDKHAGATEVQLSLLQQASSLQITLQDNGCGFEPNPVDPNLARKPGMGLVDMTERARAFAGSFALHSQPAQGTTIILHIPLTPLNIPKPTSGEKRKKEKDQTPPRR